jgi:hypothetical protein
MTGICQHCGETGELSGFLSGYRCDACTIARLEAELAEERERSCDRRDALNRMSARLLEAETRASKRNVARLEAEVAELRKRCRDCGNAHDLEKGCPVTILDSHVLALVELLQYDGARTKAEDSVLTGESLGEYQERTAASVPRRTQELTERVAQWLFSQYNPQGDWDSLAENVRYVWRVDATCLLDLVFGKEPTDG